MDTMQAMAKKTRDQLIAEARVKGAAARRRREAFESAQSELVEVLKAARAATPPATLQELADATGLSRTRIKQLSD